MTTSFSQSNSPCHRAIQYLFAIIMILIIGKLITLLPVMNHLKLTKSFVAAEIVWFAAKSSALIVFYFFTRSAITAIPNKGGILSFFRNLAEPLTVLIIVILGQALLWQVFDPFVRSTGEKIYFSLAVILIIAISIWLVLRAYQSALYLVDTSQVIRKYLSQFTLHSNTPCPNCSQQVPGNALFCCYCGHKMVEQVNCSKCGKELLADEKFCKHCGAEVKNNP